MPKEHESNETLPETSEPIGDGGFAEHSRGFRNGRQQIVWLYVFILVVTLILFAVHLSADTKHQPPAHSVDLNAATAQELQQVPGIGPSTAKAIVNFRQKSGPFQKIDDLLAIKGISKARLEKMRPYLRVDVAAYKSP